MSANDFVFGKNITFSKRLRWIRCPLKLESKPDHALKNQSNKKNKSSSLSSIRYEYLPGIIYKSYKEIINDVKVQTSQGQKFIMYCGIADMKRKKQREIARRKDSMQQPRNLKKKRKINNTKEETIKIEDDYFVAVVFQGNNYALRQFDDPALVSRILDEINETTNQTKQLPSTTISPEPNEDTYPVKTFWTNYDQYFKDDCDAAMDKVLSEEACLLEYER